jgi:tetratricopeptide (TPR) repeat protein
VLLEDRNRRVLPRWREHGATLALGELFDSKDRGQVDDRDRDALGRRASEWRSNPTLWYAADLLSSAVVVGTPETFKDAADFILHNQDGAPAPLVRLAQLVASPRARDGLGLDDAQDEDTAKRIHHIRKRLQDEHRNAIQWVELARLYVLSGDGERAIRSMGIAVSLAPDNRFVVRSAARLFYHERDALRALRIIRAAAGAKSDPWLLSAEIAVATASDFPSLLAKIGKRRNEDESLSPFEKTELSSALGTIELESGKNRHARQLFRRALVSPNENSVAQVEWANRKIGGLEVEQTVARVPRSYEASAHLAWASGEWENAITFGLGWLEDQRFSRQPAVFVSYISSLVEEYERSIRVLRASLKVNPRHPRLINNLAFALASNNQVDEAVEVLRGTNPQTASGTSAITLAATHGLVLFRKGAAELGRRFYQIAIQRASLSSELKYRFMAELYLAREELLAQVEGAELTAERAIENSSKSHDPDVAVLAARIRSLFEKRGAHKSIAR